MSERPQRPSRLILVSNRLPFGIKRDDANIEIKPSSGGLATGLRGVHARGESLWVGWPGMEPRSAEEREHIDRELEKQHIVPVHFTAAEMERFYEGVANGVIWPLFHYLIDRVPAVIRHWDDYVSANERFADQVAAHATEDDLIWVHDYHLLLLPALLRARLPKARIGFFLHIPFPSSDVIRVFPRREALLAGLLGADLVGFHTFNDQRHFAASLLSVLGLETDVDRVEVEGRSVQLRTFPMGIDANAFQTLAADSRVAEATKKLRAAHGGERLVLGVDRLDYTKGITRKFLAVELLLERRPEYRGKFRLLQIAVPSRENVSAYRELKREIEEIAGRINGAYGTLHSAPIHYVYDSVNEVELTGSYRAADVMLVTPLRDGMNLVAKEYVASRIDGDGVLVLSEFAGAAAELPEALIVNPYDVEAIAATLERALEMNENERRGRMMALRAKVASRPVEIWAETFVTTLRDARSAHSPRRLHGNAAEISRLARELSALPEVFFALDYDGTLMPIHETPEAARPDPELSALLEELSRLRGVHVAIVSGRSKDSLSDFVGSFSVALVAEHGVWVRALGDEWRPKVDPASLSWREPVLEMLKEYTTRTPGSRVEEKTAGLAWHYRSADRQLGAARAREVRLNLVQALSQQPVTVFAGRKVVEVRPQGVDKGTVTRELLEAVPADTPIVAIGDDRSDEELFRALPAEAFTFAAGPGPTRARFRLDGPTQVRSL
ncbi:MAG TPA: bifunctional alpha,alpha-trehalose-phosphate synthase (UDP-forming)/trehalose-phosphatase, partial [Polyangiaceae bacterium]